MIRPACIDARGNASRSACETIRPTAYVYILAGEFLRLQNGQPLHTVFGIEFDRKIA
jgi:hypothetical protein